MKQVIFVLLLLGWNGHSAFCKASKAQESQKPIMILSLDGGGVRGVIPATWLTMIEEQTGKKIIDQFDMVVGTSTGGIIALLLNTPDPNNPTQPKYNAKDILGLYKQLAQDVFKRSLKRKVTSLGGMLRAKYSSRPVRKLGETYFGDLRLSKALKSVVITSFDIESKQAYNFSSWLAKKQSDYNHLFLDAAMATSAAPTFFKPHVFTKPNTRGKMHLIDGGIGANNPLEVAFIKANKQFPGRELMIVSLGTGMKVEHKQMKESKIFGGAKKTLKPTISGFSRVQNNMATQMMYRVLPEGNFYRFTLGLDQKQAPMDKADSQHLEFLERKAREYANQKSKFQALIERLKELQELK